jgi:YD repeat-containing protein
MRTEIDRPDIPVGETVDAAGRVLTNKKQDGTWVEYTRDAAGNAVKGQRSNGFWFTKTYDAAGNDLRYENSDGDWNEHTRDAFGAELTFKNSDGYWREVTRRPDGSISKIVFNEGDGEVRQDSYDAAGRRISTKRVDALSEEMGELIGAPAP